MNNHSIPSTHTERKISIHSHKHSFTPYPSLSPYRQMDKTTDRGKNTLAACGLEELRVNLLLKENSYVSYIILHQSLILELKFYQLYVLICIMFSSFVKRAFLYKLFYKLILFKYQLKY